VYPILLKSYINEVALIDYNHKQINEALEIKELLRDVLRTALDAGAIVLTGGMGGDTVVDIIFAVESSTEILKAVNDAINSANEIAEAMKAAMAANISSGPDSIYIAVENAIETIIENSDSASDIIDDMASKVEDLLNRLATSVGDWVATVLPDDAGLGGILVREILQEIIAKLGQSVFDFAKGAFSKLPAQAQNFIASPEAMAGFLNEIADKIVTYLDPDGKNNDDDGFLGMASTAASIVQGDYSKLAKDKAVSFLNGDFRKMIPVATQILNKLITAFFGGVAVAQILANWNDRDEDEEQNEEQENQEESLVRDCIKHILYENVTLINERVK
jgi:tRNA A22 N-methylase